MPPSKQFNPAEFAATIARVSQGTDHGLTNPHPGYDPKQAREFKDSAVAGRKIADYKPALEAMGFSFIPAEYLQPYADGRTHEEGEWRCPARRMAWTEAEVTAFFPTPEKLISYLQKKELRKRAAKSGIVLR